MVTRHSRAFTFLIVLAALLISAVPALAAGNGADKGNTSKGKSAEQQCVFSGTVSVIYPELNIALVDVQGTNRCAEALVGKTMPVHLDFAKIHTEDFNLDGAVNAFDIRAEDVVQVKFRQPKDSFFGKAVVADSLNLQLAS